MCAFLVTTSQLIFTTAVIRDTRPRNDWYSRNREVPLKIRTQHDETEDWSRTAEPEDYRYSENYLEPHPREFAPIDPREHRLWQREGPRTNTNPTLKKGERGRTKAVSVH